MSVGVNWEAIKDEWETTDINIPDLAMKHRIKESTLRSRKSRYKWTKMDGAEVLNAGEQVTLKQVAEEHDKVVIQPEIVVKPRNPRGRDKRTATNSPWLAYMPDDVVELMRKMEQADPLDILYDQIRLQWSMIVRGQEIMYVSDQTDIDKFKSSLSDTGLSYEIHTSWDKYGKFMSAMSTAQKELRFLIQQFMDIAPVEDERRARIKAIEATTELTEQRIKALKGNTKDTTMLEVLIGAMEGVQK